MLLIRMCSRSYNHFRERFANPYRPIRLADEIYNAKVSGASSPEKPKEVSPTKKLLPSSQFHLSFFTGSTQVTLLHFHYGE